MNKMGNNIKPSYYHVPTIVAEKVKPHEAFVWSVIFWYENMESGKCFASNDTIANALPYNSSTASVANALSELEKKGLIARIFRDKAKKERIQIKCLVSYQVTPTGDVGLTHRLDRFNPQVKRVTPTGEQSINTNNKKNTNDTGFDSFWEKYPKKIDKKTCHKIWEKNNLDDKAGEIISFVEKASRTQSWEKEGGQFVPYPKTFLNGEKWNDDLKGYGRSSERSNDVDILMD